MPQLVFDPDGKFGSCTLPRSKIQVGGTLTGAKRCEYVRYCTLLTSRDPTLNYTELRDAILAIMKEDVIAHIQTLPEADQPTLLADIEQVYSTIDKSDTPFNCINIIALQTTIVFTKYLENSENPEEYHFSSYPDYVYFTRDDSWKIYAQMKELVKETPSKEYEFLVSDINPVNRIAESRPIFLAFVGFLTLGELMESILKNVFFCGLSYELHHTDGPLANPMTILWHDKFHFDNFTECYKYPTILNEFKQFQAFVVATQDKSTQYAIHLVLFCILHEEPYCYRFSEGENSLNTSFFKDMSEEFTYNELEQNIYNFVSTENQGLAIPKAYRELKEGSTSDLNEDKIKEYLHIVSKLYVKSYKEYEATKAAATGGRRKRLTRKKRISRKQNKLRRSVKR
ncbi:hypothetical protein EBU71_18705, partial [bacterium]|nr:hypothetical protein [Candidatus Elulimicrobium humile]